MYTLLFLNRNLMNFRIYLKYVFNKPLFIFFFFLAKIVNSLMVSTPPPFSIFFRAGRVKILITMKTYSTFLIIKEVHIRMRYYCFSITVTGMKGINHAHYWWGSVTDLRGSLAFRPHSYSALLWDLALSAPVVYKSSCKLATNPCSSYVCTASRVWIFHGQPVFFPPCALLAWLLSAIDSTQPFSFSILMIKKCFPNLLPPPDPE